MSDILTNIKSIYSDFIISPAGDTGSKPLDKKGQWFLDVLKADPESWKIRDTVSGESFPLTSRGTPASIRLVAKEFVSTCNDIIPKVKDPIDNLKECGFDIPPDSYPIESFEEPDKNVTHSTKIDQVKSKKSNEPHGMKIPIVYPSDMAGSFMCFHQWTENNNVIPEGSGVVILNETEYGYQISITKACINFDIKKDKVEVVQV